MCMFTLVAFQRQIAACAARLPAKPFLFNKVQLESLSLADVFKRQKIPKILAMESADLGFTGGICGVPGFDVITIPTHWTRVLTPLECSALVQRRVLAITSGSRARGVVLAAIFNMCGLSICSWMPGASFTSVAAMGTLFCWFVIWSFLGLLTLPTISRRASHWLDKAACEAGVSESLLVDAIGHVDRLQDDEYDRPAALESIFYPTTAPAGRMHSNAQKAGAHFPAWHVARVSLYLGWACGSPLARAVHCNAGRTSLWVFLPAD